MFEYNGLHDNPALTMEEVLKENEEFQRKQTEKLHKALPDIMAAIHGEDESFHDDSEGEETSGPKINGSIYPKTNGNYVSGDHERDMELLLDVRNRQVQKLEQNMDEMAYKHAAEIKALQENLDRLSMEKQRASLALKDCQDQIEKLKNIQQERDEYYQQIRGLNDEIRLLKLTINDQDRTIKMLNDASHESQRISLYQKDLDIMKQKHENEVSSLNHQLELSLQKCKSFEIDNFELEKKIKNLEERNDDMMTQKAGTITKLMTQIEELQDKLLRKSHAEGNIELKHSLLAAKGVEEDLRVELSGKEIVEKRLRLDLEQAKAELDSLKSSVMSSKRRGQESLKQCVQCKDLQTRVSELTKELNCAAVQTEAWSVDDNNAQYLRFHEEQMTNLRQECEERRLADLREKDEIIENLRLEIEQVKKKFIIEFDDSVDVRKLQEELATSTERLLELRRMHSEHCIPELQNRDKQINDLQDQVKEYLDKISILERSEMSLQEKLEKAYQDKEADLERYENDAKIMKEVILNLKKTAKTSPLQDRQQRLFTQAEMTKTLEDIARRHVEEINNYEAHINELTNKLASQASKSDTCSNEPSAELTLELWRKLEHLQSENNQLSKQIGNAREIEDELHQTTEKLKEAQGKAARLKAELLNIAEKYNRAREKFKTTKEQFCSRLADVRQTMESEKLKWEKERERWHKEQKTWDKERQLYAKGKDLWETERAKREKALRDLIAHVETLKSPQPQETVNALSKLYDDLIVSMQRLK